MTLLKRILLIILAAVLAVQFFPPEMNVSAGDQPASISRRFPVSPDLHNVLRQSCYDCHTNNTVYPWYSYIQPVGWWLADHIKEGKDHFNFDEFLNYSPRRQYHTFEEVREMIERDEMPLPSYTIIHRDAVLTGETSWMILEWSDAMRDSMRLWYPPDSLERQRRPASTAITE